MNNVELNNQKGVSLIEVLVSIIVSSLILIMLMQILMLSIAAKSQLDQDNRLTTESLVISDSIKLRIFELEPHELELIEDTANQTVIEIRHLYDITTDVDNNIIRDYSNPVTDTLVFDKINGNILYNGVQLNDTAITILDVSTIELVSIDASTCDLATDPCEQGIIKLTLTLEITLSNGHALAPQTFITTILV